MPSQKITSFPFLITPLPSLETSTHEQFEIIHEGKKLKYDFPSQKSKDKLRPLDSIEKFYISKNDHESIMTAKDLASKRAPLEAKRRHVSYAVMGVGLVCILVVLAMLVR